MDVNLYMVVDKNNLLRWQSVLKSCKLVQEVMVFLRRGTISQRSTILWKTCFVNNHCSYWVCTIPNTLDSWLHTDFWKLNLAVLVPHGQCFFESPYYLIKHVHVKSPTLKTELSCSNMQHYYKEWKCMCLNKRQLGAYGCWQQLFIINTMNHYSKWSWQGRWLWQYAWKKCL